MVTKCRGQKCVEAINRNKEKGMVLHKPGFHYDPKDYGKRTLAQQITMFSSRLRQCTLKVFLYCRICIQLPSWSYYLDYKFSKLQAICGFCITESWVSWNALGCGYALILLLLALKFLDNTWLLYYKKSFLERSGSPRVGAKIHWNLSLLPNSCITMQLPRVKQNI